MLNYALTLCFFFFVHNLGLQRRRLSRSLDEWVVMPSAAEALDRCTFESITETGDKAVARWSRTSIAP